jgi:tetratricopeptide (TPR) repeat protein
MCIPFVLSSPLYCPTSHARGAGAVARDWRKHGRDARATSRPSNFSLPLLREWRIRDYDSVMRWITCFALTAITTVAFAEGPRRTIPGKWIDRFAPEDLPKLEYPSYAEQFDKAKEQIFHGRYKQGLASLAEIKSGDAEQIALWRGRALAALGRYDEALAALDTPAGQIDRAKVQGETGKYADANDTLTRYLATHPDSIEAHYELGKVCELEGKLDAARDAYNWFVTEPHNYLKRWREEHEVAFSDAAEVTIIGKAISRWALLNNVYEKDSGLHDTIMEMFVKAYDVIDRRYWPARVAAAEYLLLHDDGPKAMTELRAARDANPNDAQAIELLGKIGIGGFNFEAIDKCVDAIRDVNPDSPAADLLEARSLLLARLPQQAEEPINRVIAKQPENLEALGLLAAAKALQVKDGAAQAILKRVEAIDKNNASAYVEVADQLSSLRQYPRAIEMYKIAVDRAPWWTSARNGLGLLYTQSGDEDLARSTLDAAHKVDPYNLKTTNYLRLLDMLANFTRKQTPHFVLVYNEKVDPVIPEYFGDYLETVYAAVTRDFAHEPAVKTYIEVFPTHEEFSVRTAGVTLISTVAASTGRVIAMVAPRTAAGTQGPFNWSLVLRHEFTHTVTLSATENRIPHWFTEGLAVWEEHNPVRWEWVPMLYLAVKTDALMPLDKLTWGFIRPKKPSDRQLAYAESLWICMYIEQTYGHDVILKMLSAFKSGQSQEQIFPAVLGKSESQFFSDFKSWTRQQIATWGYDEASNKKYEELVKQGQDLITAKKYPQAIEIWEQIAQLRPMDELPHKRLAGLYLASTIKQPEKAAEHLMKIGALEIKDNRYSKRAARLLRDSGNLDEAAKIAMQAVYIDPYDADAHTLLAEIDEKKGDERGAEKEKNVGAMIEKLKSQ